MATPQPKQCRDCGITFEPDQFAPTVFRCWSCRQSHSRKIQIAHAIVNKSIKNGSLVNQPCEVCGALKVHAHHDDYSKPLSVRWLCPLHHRRHHAQDFRATRASRSDTAFYAFAFLLCMLAAPGIAVLSFLVW